MRICGSCCIIVHRFAVWWVFGHWRDLAIRVDCGCSFGREGLRIVVLDSKHGCGKLGMYFRFYYCNSLLVEVVAGGNPGLR